MTHTTVRDPLQPRLYPCICRKYVAEFGKKRCALCERLHRRKMFGKTRCHRCEAANPNAAAGDRYCSRRCKDEMEEIAFHGDDPDLDGLRLVAWPPPKIHVIDPAPLTLSITRAPIAPIVIEERGEIPEGAHSCLCYCKPGVLSSPCHYERTGEMIYDPDETAEFREMFIKAIAEPKHGEESKKL